jgi:hypothetical protein
VGDGKCWESEGKGGLVVTSVSNGPFDPAEKEAKKSSSSPTDSLNSEDKS